MRLLTIGLSLLLFFVGVGRSQGLPPTAAAKDVVMIVGLSPTSFVDGVETEVEVTVAYELDAKPEGLIELTSNTLRPQGFSPFSSLRVVKGSGTVTLRGKLTPRFWTANIVPKIMALLVVPGEELTQRKSLATDQKRIVVALRPDAPESYALNPNPSVVYEDGIRITSISPEQFVEGQPVDVEVTVSYELLSREEAEMSLGISQGRPNSYSSASKLKVKAGKGEVVLQGRVVPKRTGSLPFAKVHVTMTESPRRTRSAPLASDSELVDVR